MGDHFLWGNFWAPKKKGSPDKGPVRGPYSILGGKKAHEYVRDAHL